MSSVGTQIALSLNDVNIDYGKNRYWKSHYWLFPPGSEAHVPTEYVSGVELRPGYQTTSGRPVSPVPSRILSRGD